MCKPNYISKKRIWERQMKTNTAYSLPQSNANATKRSMPSLVMPENNNSDPRLFVVNPVLEKKVSRSHLLSRNNNNN